MSWKPGDVYDMLLVNKFDQPGENSESWSDARLYTDDTFPLTISCTYRGLNSFFIFRFCRPKAALMNCAPFFPTHHMSCNNAAAQNSTVIMVNEVIESLVIIEKP